MIVENSSVDLIQKVFTERVLSVEYIDPGYPNSNYVWMVETEDGPRVLKVSGDTHKKSEHTFWPGLRTLFGCQPLAEIAEQASLSVHLNDHGEIPVPRILKHELSNEPLGRPYIIVEKMSGTPSPYNSSQHETFVSSVEIMEQFGRHIGKLHSTRYTHFGNFSQTRSFLPENFPQRLAHTMKELSSYVWADDTEVQESIPKFVNMVEKMPTPEHISLIMPDIVPGQFLFEDDRITALIDIESYVRGPIELELTVIELWINDAAAFQKGYEEVRKCFPNLDEVRTVYRFFIYLLFNAPPPLEKGIAKWIEAPEKFS
jgi:Ser/Thr protein kinase RdoA (MazF antagonist)